MHDQWPAGSLMSRLPAPDQETLLALGTLQEFPRGSHLVSEGDESTDVFLLLAGLVKVSADTPEGKPALLAIRAGGDLVGELAAMGRTPRLATASAAGLVRARRIRRQSFMDHMRSSPDAFEAVSISVNDKLTAATRRRIDYVSASVPVRLARVALELAARYGRPVPAGAVIDVPLSQPELAALIGVTEPSVHRAVRDLKRDGVLEQGYRRLVIRDSTRLRAIAEA